MDDHLSLFPHSNGNHSSNDNDSEIFDEEENEQPIDEIEPQQPVPHVRGGRRKGVPRRLQLSPDVIKSPSQRLLPLATMKASASNVHRQAIATSDVEDENDIENIYQSNEQNYLQLDFLSKHFVDKNNNHEEIEDILEIVDDILADIVTIIVKDVKQQRQKSNKCSTNGKSHSKGKLTDLTKTMQMNSSSSQTQVKHKLSPNSSPSATKRQKTVETNSTAALQHQQLLWEMTQQLMMSSGGMNESENASLLKQQLLGLNQVDSKRANPKPQSPNLNPTSPLPFERNNFAPRRRGRPPKYVTDRNLPSGLSGLDLDPSTLSASYDQLFAAIENGINPNAGGASAAAFQTALASMLGQQAAALSAPPPPSATRNGAPASMVKSSAGQTRHSLPTASKLSQDIGGASGLDIPLLATKKRGPGRPPKSQMLFDPHQILQATQRLNSPTHNNYPPTMVPSSPNSFNLNAAFVEMLQQQQQQH